MAVKLFVGGLSYSTSSDRLREAFAACGTVESASVVTDRDTGRSRGFGFVEMASDEDAEQAINRLNRSTLDGRTYHLMLSARPWIGWLAVAAMVSRPSDRTNRSGCSFALARSHRPRRTAGHRSPTE